MAMPDLELATAGDRLKMSEPTVSGRLGAAGGDYAVKKITGFGRRELKGMEVGGSNLARINRLKFERACLVYRDGAVVKPTERMFRLVQVTKFWKRTKFRDDKISAGDGKTSETDGKILVAGRKISVAEDAFESDNKGKKKLREKVQEFGKKSLAFGKKKVESASPVVSQSNAHSGPKNRERIAQAEISKEIKKPEKRKTVKKPGDEAKQESKRRKLGKGDAQCEERMGLIDAKDQNGQRITNGPDIEEARNHQRKRQRKQMSGNAGLEAVERKLTVAATNGDVTSTTILTNPVRKKRRVAASTTSQEAISLLRGRERTAKEASTMKTRSRASPVSTVEKPEGKKVMSKDVKDNGILQSHNTEEVEGTNATSDESKISGLDSGLQDRGQDKGTSILVGDSRSVGEDGALTVVDDFDDQKQGILTLDKNNATDIPTVEGIIADRNSPASVLTEAEGNKETEPVGNKDSKGLSIQPGKSPEAWVMCDECKKWRRIPVDMADSLDEPDSRWCCRDNLDIAFSDCSIPQEKSNAEINAELNISESSNCNENDNTDGQVDSKAIQKDRIEVAQQYVWISIERNVFRNRSQKTQTIDEIMICQCKPPEDGSPGCCGEDCLNYSLNVECVPGTCPCGDLCSNQRFQKRLYPKVKEMRCGKKGYGLFVQENVLSGTFVIEYVGEVIGLQEWQARAKQYALRGQKHFYFLKIGHEVIDACAKGNHARFINHSCDPNCSIEKWLVNGEACIGFFAKRDLAEGEELTADYQFQLAFGAAAKKCACGSAKCRGIISTSRYPENPTDIVDNESDGEEPLPIMLKQEFEDVATVIECLKSSPIEKIQDLPENKIQLSNKVLSDSVVKKPQALSSSDSKKGPVKKLKRSKAVPAAEKSRVLNTKGLEISTNRKFDGVEEILNDMLDESGGIAKRRDVAKHYLKLLVVTAASGDVNGDASGSTRDLCTRDLSMVLDALLKTKSRSVLVDIAHKNGFQLLHKMIKQHYSVPDKTPIIRKLLKILHLFVVKKVFTSEQMSSIPSREGVESFEESICILTRHVDREVQKLARQIKETWGGLPTGKSFEGKQSLGSSLLRTNNQNWRKDKFPLIPKASFMNRSKLLGRHEEGTNADCGRLMEERENIHIIDEKEKETVFEPVDEWNSNEQATIRKGKTKIDLDESKQFLDSEKQHSDSLSKDNLPGDYSGVQEQMNSGSLPLVSISEDRQWSQGPRRNFRNKNERWPPKYPSSQRNTVWHEAVPNETRLNLAIGPHVSDRKNELQHGVQARFNTVTATNFNQNMIMQPTPSLVGGTPFVPQGSGVGDGSTQEIFSPQMPVAFGIPLELFQQLHGLPICRSFESSATGGRQPREFGGIVRAPACRIPCEHFSMQQTTNVMRPFHSSGGLVSLPKFPHDSSMFNPYASAGPIGVPSGPYLGVRPHRFHHMSQIADNQIRRQIIKYESADLEQENTLEPEPPVPGLSPPRLPESSNSIRYLSPVGSVHDRNKTSDFCTGKSNLLCKKDSKAQSTSKSNNGEFTAPTVKDCTHRNISRYEGEQAAKACSSQMSHPVDGLQHVCYQSSPSCTERARLSSSEMYSPEAVTFSSFNHLSSAEPCSLEGPKKNGFSSKCDVRSEECRTASSAQSLVHSVEDREAREFSKEMNAELNTGIDWNLSHDRDVSQNLNAANIGSEACTNHVLGHLQDGICQSAEDKNIDKDFSPGGGK